MSRYIQPCRFCPLAKICDKRPGVMAAIKSSSVKIRSAKLGCDVYREIFEPGDRVELKSKEFSADIQRGTVVRKRDYKFVVYLDPEFHRSEDELECGAEGPLESPVYPHTSRHAKDLTKLDGPREDVCACGYPERFGYCEAPKGNWHCPEE